MGVLTSKSLRRFEDSHMGGIFECSEIVMPNTLFLGDDTAFPGCFLGEYFPSLWYGNRDDLAPFLHHKGKFISIGIRPSGESVRQHEYMKVEAKSIAQKHIKGRDEREKLFTIYQFIQAYFTYSQYPVSLYEAYLDRQGDCLDQSDFFMELARSAGIKAYLIMGDYMVDAVPYPHAWVIAYVGSTPVIIDCALHRFDLPNETYQAEYSVTKLDDLLEQFNRRICEFLLKGDA